MAPADKDIIYGIHPILEALTQQPDSIAEITVQESKSGPKIQEIIAEAKRKGCKLRFVERLPHSKTDSQRTHQGIMATLRQRPTLSLNELISKATKGNAAPLLLALDSIQDPHNLGAIIRSAAAAGATGVILPKDRSAPLSAVAIKASAGAIAHLDICQVTNLARALEKIKEAGFWIYGTDGQARDSIFQTDLSGSMCLIIGSEGKGMRPLIREKCDFLVSIPMQGTLNSLNASVAAGIVLFERVRQVTSITPQKRP